MAHARDGRRVFVGVDLGGTNLRGVAIGDGASTGGGGRLEDDLGAGEGGEAAPVGARIRPIAEARVAVPAARSPEPICDRIAELVRGLTPQGATLAGIGVGVAAWLDRRTGWVSNAPNLGWRDVDLRGLLESRLADALPSGVGVVLRNDLTAVTYGEWRCGAATDARDVLCVFVGSGLGSGMVVDGRLYEGASGLAGELGHVTVVDGPEGWECGCGRAGCVEAYVGGRYLEARARLPPPDGLGDAGATCSSLDQAYRRGDPAAVRLWEQAADRLGQALTIGIQLLDPEVVVLGGGALDAAPNYRDLALAALRRRCPPAMLEGTPVVPAALGPLAGALGSALLARDESGG